MSANVMETVTKLLQVQTKVMVAYAKAAALKNLPSMVYYTGESTDSTDDDFERWFERLNKRAAFAGWSTNDQL